jgi:hypothetical protein
MADAVDAGDGSARALCSEADPGRVSIALSEFRKVPPERSARPVRMTSIN